MVRLGVDAAGASITGGYAMYGMFEVAERWYMKFIPQARELVHQAEAAGKRAEAAAVSKVIEDIMTRPEHAWQKGSAADADAIRKAMEERYGKQ